MRIATVAFALAVAAAASGPTTARAALHRASSDKKMPSLATGVLPFGSRDDIARMLCGDAGARACLDALSMKAPKGEGSRFAGVGKSAIHAVAKRLADAIREAGRPAHGLHRRLFNFLRSKVESRSAAEAALEPTLATAAAYVSEALGGAEKVARLTDMEILHKVSELRRHGKLSMLTGGQDEYPYFGFLPKQLGYALPDGSATVSTATECFTNVQMNASQVSKGIQVTLTASGQRSAGCTDTYVLGHFGLGMKFEDVGVDQTLQVTFPYEADVASPSTQWIVKTQGVRIGRMRKTLIGVLFDLIDTVTLLSGYGEAQSPPSVLDANLDFMQNYVEFAPRMQPKSAPRTGGMTVAIGLNESYIQSGDSLIVIRYDGLDPMIGWGQGFAAGHTTVAIRSPTNGSLFVCESTTLDAYWPRNGIQCHPYREWIELANAAQYNVLLAPLSAANAAAFDSAAALELFKSLEGLNYGFPNFLFGWVDQAKGNFPCLPPNFEYCLEEPTVEWLALTLDELVGESPENIFRQALNFRVGTNNVPLAKLLMDQSQQNGLSLSDIYVRPEQDAWNYSTLRYGKPAVGKSMVCDVFVCNMWRAGGLFKSIGDQINCGEQTPWDIYSMQMFDPTKFDDGRPEICKQTDPNNRLCQIMGPYTFYAKPGFNSRPLYAFMGQNCSSTTPQYMREPGC